MDHAENGVESGALFVSVRRIGGMCFSSNEKASGNDKNRAVNQQKRGGKTEKTGRVCEKSGRRMRERAERAKEGTGKNESRERGNESRGREKAKCRSRRWSFPELHQRTDAFLRGMLHDGLIGRLPIGVEREGRGGTLLFVQKLKGHTVVRVVEKRVEQGAFGEIAFPTFVLCLSELAVVDDEAVVDGEEFGEEIGLTI